MKTRNSLNNTVIGRGYKSTSKSETININQVSKPFNVVDGKIVECK